jgi:hypothetical protein
MAESADRIFLVHGVGPFNAKSIPDRVGAAFGPEWPVEVIAFNWDQEVGRVFSAKSYIPDLGVLSEISGGLVNASNLGFLDNHPYVGIPRFALRIVNFGALIAQLFGWLILLLLLPRVLLPDAVWVVWYVCLSVFAGWMMLGALLSPSVAALIVCVRRILLTAAWPFAHFLATPLAFGVLNLLLLVALFPAQLFFISQWADATLLASWWLFPVYLILRVALGISIIAVGAAVAVVIHTVVAGPLKVLGDIFRYIGQPTYAARLQQGFVLEFERAVQDRTDIILLTHSLGSVIAVDCLRRYPHLTEKLKSVHLVTMGSPLKRLFANPFPNIFEAPSRLFAELNECISNFRWTNVYRPLDYIGARLSPLNRSGILECRVRQRLKLHVDYWGDPAVIAVIKQALKDQRTKRAAAPGPVIKGVIPYEAPLNLGYQGRLRPIWAHREWPLKAFFALILLRFLIWFLRSIFVPSTREIWSTSFDFGTAFLTAVGCLGLIFVLFNIRRLWRNGIARYCDSLMGKLITLPKPWGQPVPLPTPPVLRGWRRPAIMIPTAVAILAGATAYSIVVGARWHREAGPIPVGPNVRAAAFLDSEHLALARPDSVEILTLRDPSASRRLLYPKDYGKHASVAMSSNGQWVAVAMSLRSDNGTPDCLQLLHLPTDPTATTMDKFTPKCPEGGLDDVDLDVSNRGDFVVVAGKSAQVYFSDSGSATELRDGKDYEGTVRRVARFTPRSDCLIRRGARELLRYCAQDQWTGESMGALVETFDDFAVGKHLFLGQKSRYSSPRLTLLDEHANQVAALDEASDIGGFDHPAIAMSGDEERVALVNWNEATVWAWRTRDYGESAKTVLSEVAGLPTWKALREHFSATRAARSN